MIESQVFTAASAVAQFVTYTGEEVLTPPFILALFAFAHAISAAVIGTGVVATVAIAALTFVVAAIGAAHATEAATISVADNATGVAKEKGLCLLAAETARYQAHGANGRHVVEGVDEPLAKVPAQVNADLTRMQCIAVRQAM